MANIKITNLQPLEVEFSELSNLELESIVGGKCNSDTTIGRESPDSEVYRGA